MQRTLSLLVFSVAALAQQLGAPSQEELLKQVIAGIEAKDETALKQLTISKAQFNKYVWPVIAARVAGPGTTVETFHAMYVKSSGLGIAQDLDVLGGKKLQVVKVSPGQIQKQTRDYTLFLAPDVIVRDAAGAEQTVHPVGGLLQQGGSFKVTTYYVGAQKGAK